MPLPRSRLHYSLAALLCIALGLATRPLKHVSDALGSALGDALWAILVFLLLVIALPRLSSARAASAATVIAWGVEGSQLASVAWLDDFRRTTIGTLTVGGTFSLGDLACYVAGILIAFLLDHRLQQHRGDGVKAS